jgi:hypothetical protein
VPKYLVLYRADVPADVQMADVTPEQAQQGMALWMQWAEKAGDSIVDLGSPLVAAGVVGDATEGDMPIGGFSILQADSRAAIQELLADHPHFHTPGKATIEIHEFAPMPGM